MCGTGAPVLTQFTWDHKSVSAKRHIDPSNGVIHFV